MGGSTREGPRAMATEVQENSLFDRLARGEEGSVDDLCRRYEGWVAKAVRRRMGRALRSRLEAMDLAQEVMIHVIRDAPGCRFPTEGHFCAWLGVVVERRILREARRWRSPSSGIWNTAHSAFQGVRDPAAEEPHEPLARLETTGGLDEAIARSSARGSSSSGWTLFVLRLEPCHRVGEDQGGGLPRSGSSRQARRLEALEVYRRRGGDHHGLLPEG